VALEKGIDLKIAKWDQCRTWNMRLGIFWRRTNIQQLMGHAGASSAESATGGMDFKLTLVIFLREYVIMW
jgi:hypothetical protein